MKVSVTYVNSSIPKEKYEFINDFIKFLQKEYPLKHDLTIRFLGHREGGMTTGSRNKEHILRVLTNKRLTRDILRTLAHEWVHEYQMTILNRKKGPNIGGKNEDEANAKSGMIMKKYEKQNPENEDEMYR